MRQSLGILRMFQHTAARRRLASAIKPLSAAKTFQHTAARRRLEKSICLIRFVSMFQHTAARRRLESIGQNGKTTKTVSTHSRPKAAGYNLKTSLWPIVCFNTQPPEGGWFLTFLILLEVTCFNTQPPEGGWTPRRSKP